MVARQALVVALVMSLAIPSWAFPTTLGNVTHTHSARVRGSSLVPGSTIFSGDLIEVGEQGNASITLSSDGNIYLSENSMVRLMSAGQGIRLLVDRGRATFRTTRTIPFEALLADATIRSQDGLPAVGTILVRSPDSAIIAALKGTLIVATAHDSGSYTLREGEGAEVSLAPENSASNSKHASALPAGSMTLGKVVIISAILAGLVTGVGILLGQTERKHTTRYLCNEVSPFRCF